MKKLVLTSNFLNERPQLEGWLNFVKPIADGGILVVDGGSTDGTIEFLEENGVTVIVDNIIQREGYGPARNHLREMAKKHFPEAAWMAYFDADEVLDEEEFHQLRYLKDYLIEEYDVIAFPRIDWYDKARTKAAKDWKINPDWQARMTRLDSPITYIRRLHEQMSGHKKIFDNMASPKINHFHRETSQEKRDLVGKLCAKLHMEDLEHGASYPEHHREAGYRERYLKEGLNG